MREVCWVMEGEVEVGREMSLRFTEMRFRVKNKRVSEVTESSKRFGLVEERFVDQREDSVMDL